MTMIIMKRERLRGVSLSMFQLSTERLKGRERAEPGVDVGQGENGVHGLSTFQS